MTDRVLYWISTILSGAALLLIVVNMTVISGNRDLQIEIGQRQATIDTALRLSQLNQNLIQALADTSIKNKDKDIRDLLSSQGITIRENERDANADTTAKKK